MQNYSTSSLNPNLLPRLLSSFSDPSYRSPAAITPSFISTTNLPRHPPFFRKNSPRYGYQYPLSLSISLHCSTVRSENGDQCSACYRTSIAIPANTPAFSKSPTSKWFYLSPFRLRIIYNLSFKLGGGVSCQIR